MKGAKAVDMGRFNLEGEINSVWAGATVDAELVTKVHKYRMIRGGGRSHPQRNLTPFSYVEILEERNRQTMR